VCVCLGDRTVFGRIAEQAASERRGRTTLEKEITRFVIIIAALAFTVAAFIVSELFELRRFEMLATHLISPRQSYGLLGYVGIIRSSYQCLCCSSTACLLQ
jgi:magnesium-transporting ATPase (P-type)